ncbi:dTDP-4-dehydrorhamnose 3,5-epimerase [Synechococcus sp. CCY 9618]|uniref:dTDP-4-dehydrorhamnose 3,5-epimerase n=1 Tax=Synechococcus sp. CCY 9618 TaxID=2815602 RepID=UPI001C241817|nr:dTDP-4-dehydrorhamnose 3,5-epimerase [Synechococcus sp. CCY 9618]
MNVQFLAIEGPLLLTPAVYADDRGWFSESWNRRRFAEVLGCEEAHAPDFVQDNHSRSIQGVLRGLHFQRQPHPQGKLVRCTLGEVFDVVVDLRQSSPTLGQWVGERLSAENSRQLWVPVGFAHGFLTLSAVAEVQYKTAGYWSRECERTLAWNDPALGIDWPLQELPAPYEPLLAPKDAGALGLEALEAAGDLFSAHDPSPHNV